MSASALACCAAYAQLLTLGVGQKIFADDLRIRGATPHSHLSAARREMAGRSALRLTFTHRGPDLISADHTGAPDELKGAGLAAAMVDYLVADARARGFKVIPICPYIRALYQKHPEWRDVFTVAPGEKPKLTAAQMRGE